MVGAVLRAVGTALVLVSVNCGRGSHNTNLKLRPFLFILLIELRVYTRKRSKTNSESNICFISYLAGHCTGNEGQCFGNEGNSKSSTLTSGDSNSEMCTTTDVEVDETFHKMKLTFEQETDDEELLIVENSKQMVLPIQNSSSAAENDLTDKGETMVTDIDGKFEIKDESAMENETEQLNKSDINSNCKKAADIFKFVLYKLVQNLSWSIA